MSNTDILLYSVVGKYLEKILLLISSLNFAEILCVPEIANFHIFLDQGARGFDRTFWRCYVIMIMHVQGHTCSIFNTFEVSCCIRDGKPFFTICSEVSTWLVSYKVRIHHVIICHM